MALSTDDHFLRAKDLARNIDDTFLDLARSLRVLNDEDRALFRKVVDSTQIGLRKAYYLVEISRVYEPLPISKARLRQVGWTKLQLMAKFIDEENMDEMLALAEKSTTKQLEATLKGHKPLTKSHCILMYLTPKQYKEFEDVMLANGAKKSGRGLLDKEAALMRVLKRYKKADLNPS